MNQIIINDQLKAQLDGLAEPVEVIDTSGQRIGHFIPTQSSAAATESPFSPEEMEAMRREQGGRQLEDIWKSLGAK